jgi:MFS family permease
LNDSSGKRAQSGWYLGGIASWFLGTGAQMSLFPYLIAVVLEADARNLGIAQTSAMLPALLLMLLGGAAADRVDCRTLLIRLHVLAALPPLVLAAVVAYDAMTYVVLLSYGISMGCVSAFVVPARDSLLSRVAGSDVQRTVIATMGIQNVSQIVGTVIGGFAAAMGAPTVLICQSLAMLAGSLACAQLLPAPPVAREPSRTGAGTEIRAGLSEVLHNPRILSVTVLAAAIGLFFMGSFMVAIPLLLRDTYGGSAPQIAAGNASMMLGMLAGTGLLFARGGVRRQGRALILSLVAGALVLGSLSLAPPELALYAMIFCFGAGGGIAMPSGRTLVQEAASDSQRARVLSVYSLGFMGAAPFGALMMGFLVEALGARTAVLVPAALMLATIAATTLLTNIWSFHGAHEADPPDVVAKRL